MLASLVYNTGVMAKAVRWCDSSSRMVVVENREQLPGTLTRLPSTLWRSNSFEPKAGTVMTYTVQQSPLSPLPSSLKLLSKVCDGCTSTGIPPRPVPQCGRHTYAGDLYEPTHFNFMQRLWVQVATVGRRRMMSSPNQHPSSGPCPDARSFLPQNGSLTRGRAARRFALNINRRKQFVQFVSFGAKTTATAKSNGSSSSPGTCERVEPE